MILQINFNDMPNLCIWATGWGKIKDPHTELDNLISTELDNCLISTELDSEISTQLDNCQISTQLDKINFT